MLRRNIQEYVDDMVVTSEKKYQHIADLEELFALIAKYNLKLNPDKCVFRVEAWKFLHFLLTKRGIKANPDKCETIIEMRSPTNVKEVQQLTGCMAPYPVSCRLVEIRGTPTSNVLRRKPFCMD